MLTTKLCILLLGTLISMQGDSNGKNAFPLTKISNLTVASRGDRILSMPVFTASQKPCCRRRTAICYSDQQTTKIGIWKICIYPLSNIQSSTVISVNNDISASQRETPSISSHASFNVAFSNGIILSTQNQHDVGSSLRCMIVPLYEKAGRREFLAMHCNWLAVWTYLIYYKVMEHSAELCG